jgi:NAD(P)H-flavin reductase
MSAIAEPSMPNSPASFWQSRPATIEAVEPEIAGVVTCHLRLADAAVHDGYRFQPGQFNMLYVPGVGEVAISMSGPACDSVWPVSDRAADATEGLLLHTIRIAGNTSREIARLGVGGCVGLRGPYGSAWPLDQCLGRDVVVVAGGIGLAPLRPAILALLANRQRIGRTTLLYGARSPKSLLFQKNFADWAAAGLQIRMTVDRGLGDWSGHIGVTHLLVDRLPEISPANTIMLICGPELMMRYAARSALARGLLREQIWLSLERNMQCAVGLCGHCQLGPTFVCKNGPVYRYDAVERFLEVPAL